MVTASSPTLEAPAGELPTWLETVEPRGGVVDQRFLPASSFAACSGQSRLLAPSNVAPTASYAGSTAAPRFPYRLIDMVRRTAQS